MPMWSDLPDQADVEARRAARLDRRRAVARRSRLRRLTVTLTTLALLVTGGVVVLRSGGDPGTAQAAGLSASSAAPSSDSSAPVADRAREAVVAAIAAPSDAPAPSEPAPTGPEVPETVSREASTSSSGQLPAKDLPVVSEGDYGSVVEVAQRALDVEPTGYFGPKTRAAVAEYQQEVGLPTTGQIATFTWSALGEETVASALAVVDTPDGYVDAEPAEIQESAAPKVTARNVDAGDPPVLEETDSGESVAVVQRALGVKPATGYFGPLTVKAVKRFQSDNGIPTTGVIATYTWGALGKQIARDAAIAHSSYGTAFGPGAPKRTGGGKSSSGGGGNGAGGSSSQGRDGLFCPVKNFSYGDGLGAPRPDGRTHQGLDLMGGRGEPIYAIDSGTVTRSGYQSNGAMILDITGPRGMYFYGHFDKITVGYGDSVKAGQLIGYMGDTGSSGAVHLHLEVRPNGWSGGYDDPVPLIKSLCG